MFLAGAAATPVAAGLASCSGGSGGRRAVPDPVQFVRTRWANDPFARGAYSYLQLGARTTDRSTLATPVDDQLYFAGEATSGAHPATVRGAVESGRRAATELRAAGASASTRVVIIGAGAAGLAAAAELRSSGISPVVLEARDRIGGRVHTDLSLGVPVDLGAAWVHGAVAGNPLLALARRAGVTLDGFDDSLVLHGRDGRRRKDGEGIHAELAEAIARVGAGTQADAELATALRVEAERRGLRDPDLTYAITTQVEHELGASAAEISWRAFEEGDDLGDDAVPRGGFAALLAPLTDGVDIRLRTVVVRVEWSRARSRVVTDAGDVPFDMAVVTLPLGVLQAGAPVFEPPLPAAKTGAIGRLGMGLVDKLALRFDEVFWDVDASWIGYVGTTPGEWVEWLNLHPLVGRPILVGFNSARTARALDARTDEQVVSSAMAALRTMFG